MEGEHKIERNTIELFKTSSDKTKEEAKEYSRMLMVNVDIKGTLHPQAHMKSDLVLDD